MLKLARPATVPEPTRAPLDAAGLSRLFLEPRTHSHWLDLEVPDELLEEAWNLTRLAPTSANSSPMRLVLLRSPEEKERLVPAQDAGNRTKSLTAPVVAILAYDCEFWRTLPRLYPHTDAAAWYRHDPPLAEETALRNGTLRLPGTCWRCARWASMSARSPASTAPPSTASSSPAPACGPT